MNTHSEKIDQIAAALRAAQSSMGRAVKDSDNPFFKSKYADLHQVWNACHDALDKNKLVVVQGAVTIDGKPHMETKIIHESGQWLTSYWQLSPNKPDPQAMGSAISYMRRYSLAAMVGVLTEDDDGEAAMDRQSPAVKFEFEAAKAIENAKSMDELKTYWQSMMKTHGAALPNGAMIRLEGLKNKRKAELEKAA